jgi:murein DD-endopeptidase MepM/ murein hydrolase activator NlpD
MKSFNIDFSSPFPKGFRHGIGGPDGGGHKSKYWYIQYGMDLGANVGTEVRAAFDGHITRYNPHKPSHDTAKVYGAEIFMRSKNNKMGGFYTHLTNVPDAIRLDPNVKRGDLLGTVYVPDGGGPHLHMALVEIIGGAPNGRYMGVDLYEQVKAISNSSAVKTITFTQDGSPPTMS